MYEYQLVFFVFFFIVCFFVFVVFFFQAEDGIRDIGVTGVQTCALPILIYIDKLQVFSSSLLFLNNN